MKRRALISEIIARGCVLKRHGHNHDVYFNPQNGRSAPVPRHKEIADTLCRLIKRQLGIE